MHFEGHPTGVDVVNLVLHMVDTIRDAVSGRAATEKNETCHEADLDGFAACSRGLLGDRRILTPLPNANSSLAAGTGRGGVIYVAYRTLEHVILNELSVLAAYDLSSLQRKSGHIVIVVPKVHSTRPVPGWPYRRTAKRWPTQSCMIHS